MRVLFAAAFAASVFGGPAFSQQQRAIDMRLVDAGFKMRPAITPQQIEHLRKLPAKRFVPQTSSGRRYYLYVDPDDCKCIFVGDDKALQAYRNMPAKLPQPDPVGRGPGGLAPDAVIIHEMNEDLPNLDLFSHPF